MNHLFIVGAQRSGSTYLYHVLNDHPEIIMAKPLRPEPKFFLNDKFYGNGPSYYESVYFGQISAQTHYLGEKSTSYIESKIVPKRIWNYYPSARILMILRNPVIRAYSNYRFSVEHKLENLPFEIALQREPARLQEARFRTSVNPYAYRQRGHYIDYIEEYLKFFSRSQLNILIFEEFVGNLPAIQRLYRWLGIDDSYKPNSFRSIFNPTVRTEDDQIQPFRDLALSYKASLERLENLLGRRVEVWRHHWEMLEC